MHGKGAVRQGGLAALVMACAALVLPSSVFAGTVGVEEFSTEPRKTELVFVANAAESTDLSVSIAGEVASSYELRLLDDDTSIKPGPGCSGGGEPGVEVRCNVHKPTPGESTACLKGCVLVPGTRWELVLTFKLGDGGSRLDTTAVPDTAPDQHPLLAAPPISVVVIPGAGDDTVLTGPGPDVIESSPGADLVRTGGGFDRFNGGPHPDGPDNVYLGEDATGTIDYSRRNGDLRYDPNGLADDGAAGEDDNLGGASLVKTGAGDDVLNGGAHSLYGNVLIGGGGDDTIHGTSNSDDLFGGKGDDELVGGKGDDLLTDPSYRARGSDSGNDVGAGGAGRDEIQLGSGDDDAVGGKGDDRIALGAGEDRAVGDSGRDLIKLGSGQDRGAGGAGGDLVLGEQGEDEIFGGPGNDRLSGDSGRDLLLGDAGNDRIAAGMIVANALELPEFLASSGALEAKPDRIDCGGGRDGAKPGDGDSTTGCEAIPRASLLELGWLRQSDGYSPPLLHVVIRRPGTVKLEGKGVQPKQLVNERSHGGWGAPLWPTGQSLKVLLRDGHVRLRLKFSFNAVDGREIVRFRTVDLWLPVDLDWREPI